MVSGLVKHVIGTAVVIGYILIGAYVFHLLETPEETQLAQDLQETADKLHELLTNLTCVNGTELKNLLNMVNKLRGATLSFSNTTGLKADPGPSMWAFDQAVFFCITIVSTIGYGNISPTTAGSRAFCAIYAMIGIPLFLILLARIGAGIASYHHRLMDKACCKYSPRTKKIIGVLSVAAIGALVVFLLPGIVFSYSEGWTYDVALYYTFITVSTIGFGDYVPGTYSHWPMRVLFSVWIAYGLAWFAMFINTIQDMMQTSGKQEPETLPDAQVVENGHKLSSEKNGIPNGDDVVTSHL